MKAVVLGPPPPEFERLLDRRKRLGQDGYDEVWEGVYHMALMSRGRHGYLQVQLAKAIAPYAEAAGLAEVGPFNLGDGADDFRVPDLGYHRQPFDPGALYYPTAAIVVEVISPGDETYDKLPFYAAHAVAEVLVADPEKRSLRLLALDAGHYRSAGRSALLGVELGALGRALRWP